MISAGEFVRRVAATPAPVLLSDTCSILDVMRDPTRDNFSGPQVEAALRIVGRCEARPRTLWSPIAAQVIEELDNNQVTVEQEAATKIRKLEETVLRVREIMSAHGLQTAAPGLIAAGFPVIARALVARYVAAAPRLTNPRGVQGKAWARIAANLAPAQRGQQAKDCVVLETYLHVARELRAAGLHMPIVFFTTNTGDYSDPAARAAPHPTLAAEFQALDLRYAVNFQMTEHLLI
jgi:hypothetical protein